MAKELVSVCGKFFTLSDYSRRRVGSFSLRKETASMVQWSEFLATDPEVSRPKEVNGFLQFN
jgi:hypothetical protein